MSSISFIVLLDMSTSEEKGAEVIVMDVTSPVSSSTSTSDSESMSDVQEEPTELFNRLQPEDDEEEEEEEEEDAEGEGKQPSDILVSQNDSVLFMREIPRSSGSTSPLEMKEERSSDLDYPLSQRVYSNPPCKMSAVLQRQSRELWDQFDSIGTEMIVTRRGRLDH